jgi:FMN-dependent NADH-azoreductase
MGKLVHIQTSLRGGCSASQAVAKDFIDGYRAAYINDLAEQEAVNAGR